jgi:hypothetical protein
MFSVVFAGCEDPIANFSTFEEARKYIIKLKNILYMECPEMIGKFNIVVDNNVVY